MQPEKKIAQIDIESIIRAKNPSLLKSLPRPILNYMKRILHQEDVNSFLRAHHDQYDIDFVRAITAFFQLNIASKGLENIPKTGGIVIASNHPLGGLDSMTLAKEVGSIRTDIKFLVNDILMNLHNMNSLFVPINKHGKNAVESLKLLDQAYSSDNCILIFPAGLVSRKQNGVIKDLEWKKSFINKAVKHKRNIVPVYMDAVNSPFFYNLALWRKRLGIKANIEMFYLVDEMYKQRGKKISITFGEQIPYTRFTKDFSDHYWAQKVKEHVYGLGSGVKVL